MKLKTEMWLTAGVLATITTAVFIILDLSIYYFVDGLVLKVVLSVLGVALWCPIIASIISPIFAKIHNLKGADDNED